MPKPLTHRWLVLLTIAAACGYEKTSPLPPGTVNPLPSAPSVSFTSPASMQHVPAKFTVTMAASFTGPLDAYVLTLPSGVSLAVPADPTGAVVVDASAVPNGMLALTATISQNGLSSTATLTVVVDRTLLTPILTPLTGFYKLNENVPMGATFPAGSPVHDVNFVTPAGTLPGVIDEATGVWSASVLAMSLGRGDVTISVNAADALGNAGSTTSGTFTIGLLHDTACPTCKGQLQLDVVTPAGEGILYAANIDTTAAGTVSATQNLGDLRFTTFGGGATVTIASRVCFNTSAPSATGEGADVIVSADASRILFTSAPATTTGAPVCSQLMASALPPASGTTTPQQVGIGLTVPLNPGMDVLSSDGTVGVWSPDGTTMVGGAVGQPAIPPVTLTETFMASDVSGRWLPLNGSLLVPAPDGTALYILNEAGLIPLSVGSGPSAVAVTTSTISTNYWSKTGVPSADGSAALVLGGDEKTLYSVNATDGVVTPICTPPACTFSNQSSAAGPVVPIAGGYVVFQALDSNGNPELGYYTGAGAASFVTGGEFPLDTSDYNSGNRPRDGSGLPILVPPASGVVGRSDVVFLSPPSPTASPGPYTTQVLASNLDTDGANVNFVQYESNWWWGDAPYLFRSFFNRFDDSDHCFVFDDRGLFFDKVGASPVAIGAGSPERFAGLDEDNGPIIFLPGRKTVLIPFNDTGGDYYNPPAGNLWAYTLESGAAVQLVPPSPSTATNVILPVGDDANWSTSAGAAADLLSARHVVFGVQPLGQEYLQVYVVAVDGTGARQVTKADNSDAAALNDPTASGSNARRFGVTSDDATVWWYAVDGHLWAQPLAGGANVDLGPVEPRGIMSLPGGVFFATTTVMSGEVTEHQMEVVSLTQPTPTTLGAPMSDYPFNYITSYRSIAVSDDQSQLYVLEQQAPTATPLPQSAWVVNAQGATQLATNAVQFVLDYDAGFGFVLGPTGELELLDQHAGATPIMLEPGGTAAPVTIAGAGSASRPSNGEEGEIRTLFTGAGMPGHAQPGIGGQFVWYGIGGGESDYEFGARQRYALSYIVGGTSRPGVYIYDTVGGTFSGPN